MRTFVAFVLLAASPLSARAQPGLTEPSPPPPPAQEDEEGDQKSPGVALGLSLAGTAAGWGALIASAESGSEGLGWLGVTGIMIGPSLGHFYAGEVGRGLGHTGIRAGAGAIFVTGAMVAFSDCFFTEEEECDGSPGPIIMLGGAVLGLGSTIYSVVDAPRAASRQNRKNRRVLVTPGPVVGPGRSTGMGLQVGASF